jgi:hypothetical protein
MYFTLVACVAVGCLPVICEGIKWYWKTGFAYIFDGFGD